MHPQAVKLCSSAPALCQQHQRWCAADTALGYWTRGLQNLPTPESGGPAGTVCAFLAAWAVAITYVTIRRVANSESALSIAMWCVRALPFVLLPAAQCSVSGRHRASCLAGPQPLAAQAACSWASRRHAPAGGARAALWQPCAPGLLTQASCISSARLDPVLTRRRACSRFYTSSFGLGLFFLLVRS